MIAKKRGVLFALVSMAQACVLFTACSKVGSESTDPPAGDTVVAHVGEVKITQQELDAAVQVKNAKAVQAFYDARRAVLEELIRTRIVKSETEARGITEEELFAEATKDVPLATDVEIAAFFNSNTPRMGGRSLQEMQPQIRNFLDNSAKQTAATKILKELKEKYGVKLFLEPPRMEVEIAANDPTYGPEDAPILLVEFSDFQ